MASFLLACERRADEKEEYGERFRIDDEEEEERLLLLDRIERSFLYITNGWTLREVEEQCEDCGSCMVWEYEDCIWPFCDCYNL